MILRKNFQISTILVFFIYTKITHYDYNRNVSESILEKSQSKLGDI